MYRWDGKSHGIDSNLSGSQHMNLLTLRDNCQLRPMFLQLITISGNRKILSFSDDEKCDLSCIGLEMSMLIIC